MVPKFTKKPDPETDKPDFLGDGGKKNNNNNYVLFSEVNFL